LHTMIILYAHDDNDIIFKKSEKKDR